MEKISVHELVDMIADESYTRLPNSTINICRLILKSGFSVIGYSATMDEKNYDDDIGKQCAYEKAFEQLWEFEGYHRLATAYENKIL